MVKLFYCVAVTTDHDWVEILVAENQEKAEIQFNKMVEESDSWYAGISVHELTFAEYEVTIKKKS